MPQRKRNNKKRVQKKKRKQFPFVSICTPTFNRRPFFEQCFRCLEAQTYPHDRLEWIVYDDGTDCVKDLIDEFATRTKINVRYFQHDTQLSLAEKRNFLNSKVDGAFVCYWDDDDYYFPTRIQDAVQALQQNPDKMIAGGSQMYCYYHDTNEIWSLGPYGPNHSTAAVLVFRKELLNTCSFNDELFIAEERSFLKNCTIPLLQMPVTKTILVIAHSQNSCNKYNLITQGETQYVKKTKVKLETLVPDHEARYFITTGIHEKLKEYTAGDLRKKPDILLSMFEKQSSRIDRMKKSYKELAQSHNTLIGQIGLLYQYVRAFLGEQIDKKEIPEPPVKPNLDHPVHQNVMAPTLQHQYKQKDENKQPVPKTEAQAKRKPMRKPQEAILSVDNSQ